MAHFWPNFILQKSDFVTFKSFIVGYLDAKNQKKIMVVSLTTFATDRRTDRRTDRQKDRLTELITQDPPPVQ